MPKQLTTIDDLRRAAGWLIGSDDPAVRMIGHRMSVWLEPGHRKSFESMMGLPRNWRPVQMRLASVNRRNALLRQFAQEQHPDLDGRPLARAVRGDLLDYERRGGADGLLREILALGPHTYPLGIESLRKIFNGLNG